MNKLLITLFASVTCLSAVAQTPDLKEGYTFNYSQCYPPEKKKDAMGCVLHNHTYYIDGRFNLVSEYKKVLPLNTRLNTSYRSTVKVTDLSFDYRIEKSDKGYQDSTLAVRELWTLRLETSSHDQDVMVESNSEILGPDTGYSYLLILTFPAKEAAEAAWSQIREIRNLIK